MLQLKDVVKNYGSGENVVKALNGVSITFRENEFVAILGHSGCGKTTITMKASETQKYKATEKKITITVKPKKAVLSTVKLSKATTAVVKWKKDTKSSGYLLQYSTNKKFKNTKSITIKSNKTTSKKITNLKKGKTYYVRICAYKVSNGKKVYGKYSGVRRFK